VPPRMPPRFSLKHWLHLISSVNAAQDRFSPGPNSCRKLRQNFFLHKKSRTLCTGPHTLQQKQASIRNDPSPELARERNRATRSQATRGHRRTPICEICYKMHTTCIVDCDNMWSDSSAISKNIQKVISRGIRNPIQS
jgi:hypothetical protein